VFPNVFDNGVAGGGNSTFTFTYNGAGPFSVTVPPAWYTAAQYATALQAALNASIDVLNPVVVTLTFVGSTAFFTFTASGGDTIGLLSKTSGNAAGDLTGIIVDVPDAVTVKATAPPDFGGLSTVYLSSGVLAGNNCAASSRSGEQVPVLMGIPINVEYGQQVYYESKDHINDAIVFSAERNLNSVDLSLQTRSGDVLDLFQNNLTVLLCLINQAAYPRD
jgi:hypothetical protein